MMKRFHNIDGVIRGLIFSVFFLAASGLVGAQDAATVEKLLPLLKDSDATVRLGAVRSIGTMGLKTYAPPLLPLLEDEDGRVRWAVATAFRTLDAKYLERDICNLLRRPQGSIRGDAAYCLSAIGSKAFVSELKDLLSDPDPRARAAAAFALGQLHQEEFAREVSVLLEDKDARVRWAALSTLRKLKATPFNREVAKLVADHDPLLRWSAWYTLYKFNSKGWISTEIDKVLPDLDPGVRGDAALAVGLFEVSAYSSNVAALLQDSDPRVRWSAVRVLHHFVAKAYLKEVQALLEDSDRDVRREAAAAIPALDGKTPKAEIPMLEDRSGVSSLGPSTVFVHGDYSRQVVQLTESLEGAMHWSIALTLGKIPGRAGVDDLESLLAHPLPEVRRSAVWILDQWDSPDALGVLRRAADQEKDSLVRTAIAPILQRTKKSN